MPSFYYLYCLTDKTKHEFPFQGIDRKEIYTVSYKDITGVVTQVDSQEFTREKIETKIQEDLDWAKEKIINHETVIRETMKESTVIPLKFLTLYKSETGIENLLEREYGKFRQLFDKLKEKAEWGLKVYLVDEKALLQNIAETDKEILKEKAEIEKAPAGTKYFLNKKVEGKIKAKLNTRLDEYLKKIQKTFLSFSVEEPVTHDLPPQQGLYGKNREIVLSVSYLVPNEKIKQFQTLLKKMQESYSQGLQLQLSGPWAAYSFVT